MNLKDAMINLFPEGPRGYVEHTLKLAVLSLRDYIQLELKHEHWDRVTKMKPDDPKLLELGKIARYHVLAWILYNQDTDKIEFFREWEKHEPRNYNTK